MDKRSNHGKIQDALDTIASIGANGFDADYKGSRCDKIGAALGHELYSRDIAEIAYSAWEQMNAHALASVLNWCMRVCPRIDENELDLIRWVMQTIRDVTYRDEETNELKTKIVRAVVTFEDVTDEEDQT